MSKKMDSFDYWKICDKLSIFQVLLLALGVDPALRIKGEFEDDPSCDKIMGVYEAMKTALAQATVDKVITGDVIYHGGDYGHAADLVDIESTKIVVQDVRKFFSSKGVINGFFSADSDANLSYLNPNNPHYAPKLAAAIGAWQAVTADDTLLNGKTPKQALEKWLRENASQYGLTKDDGNPNETGIDEVSKMANWKPEGGAAKTPVKRTPPTPETRIKPEK